MGFVQLCDDPKFWYIKKKSTDEIHRALLDSVFQYIPRLGDSTYDRATNYPGQVNKVLQYHLPDTFRKFVVETVKEYSIEITNGYYRSLNHIDFDKDLRFGIPNKFGYGTDGQHGRLLFRSKYEYTPLHINYGTLHFTYWVKVPFTQTQEKKAAPNPQPEHNIPDDVSTENGSMYFSFPSHQRGDKSYETGKVDTEFIHLYTSKKSEGVLCLYPNYLMNGTQPFYSTDEYMIECTGPITFEKPESLI